MAQAAWGFFPGLLLLLLSPPMPHADTTPTQQTKYAIRHLSCPFFNGIECSGQGDCMDSKAGTGKFCQCITGYGGADCSMANFCPKFCSGHGKCMLPSTYEKQLNPLALGICQCDNGFLGIACDRVGYQTCPNFCSGHGLCKNATCICHPGFEGEDCSEVAIASACPAACSGHGTCGPHCDPLSPGSCKHQLCYCDKGYTGDDCATVVPHTCERNCGAHGKCASAWFDEAWTDVCECHLGFSGEHCDEVVPGSCGPSECSGRGFCLEGKCMCWDGFSGEECETIAPNCTANCYGHGRCSYGLCLCEKGFHGRACEHITRDACPHACSAHGSCLATWSGAWWKNKLRSSAACECDTGFGGEACDEVVMGACHDQCSARGRCRSRAVRSGHSIPYRELESTNQCECDFGAGGDSCVNADVSMCPWKCSAVGLCIVENKTKQMEEFVHRNYPKAKRYCHCHRGYKGDGCEVEVGVCPNDCSGHGMCLQGGNWVVPPATCKHRAEGCKVGKCKCKRGWGGIDCRIPCPSFCSGHGECDADSNIGKASAKCVCDKGWWRETCDELLPCLRNCSGRGECKLGVCTCSLGWLGEDCSFDGRVQWPLYQSDCPNHCSGNGVCVEGECKCAKGYYGEDCSMNYDHRFSTAVEEDELIIKGGNPGSNFIAKAPPPITPHAAALLNQKASDLQADGEAEEMEQQQAKQEKRQQEKQQQEMVEGRVHGKPSPSPEADQDLNEDYEFEKKA